MQKLFALFLPAALCGTFAAAQQIGCQATTSSVVGSYPFIATEVPLSGVILAPPGTTTNQQVYSSTAIGRLVGSINAGGTFSMAGVLYFDGGGHIAAASSPLAPWTNVGTYNVNTDCTINVTLTDVFNTATPGPGVTTPTFGTTNLIGLVLGGGTEIDLSAAQSSGSTNGNTPLVAGEFASRLDIQLVRSFTYGCNAASLIGAYGLVGSGYALANLAVSDGKVSGAAQSATFFARLRFDGNGNVIADTVTSPSPLASFQYVGSYTLNLDCSGTMVLGAPPSTASASTAPTVNINFVLTPPTAYLTGATTNLSGNAARPGLQFTLSNSAETLSGYGRAQ